MAIVIDLELKASGANRSMSNFAKRAQDASSKIDDLTKKYRGLADAIQSAADQMDRLRMPIKVPSLRAPGGGGGGSGSGTPTPAGKSGRMADPYDYYNYLRKTSGGKMTPDLANAANQAVQHLMSGPQAGSASSLSKLGTIHSQMAKMQNANSFVQLAKNAIYSTRFGVGGSGGIQPLIGRTMQALSALSPAISAGATAVTIFAQVVRASADKITAVNKTRALGGGSAEEAAQAERIGNYFGTSGSELAQRLQSGLNSGVGAGFASRYGINPVGGPFGDNDYNRKLSKLVDGLARDIDSGKMSRNELRRITEAMGVPEIASMIDLRPDQRAKLVGRQGLSEQDAKAAAQFNFELNDLGQAITRIAYKSGPLLSLVTAQVEQLAFGFEAMAAPIILASRALDSFLQNVSNLIDKITGKKTTNNNSIDNNTKATEELTREMRKATFGGGNRAANSLPRGISGQQLDDAAFRRALGTGLV